MSQVIDLAITRGKTFAFGFLYAEDELLYLPITAMPSKAPVRLTVVAHGVPDGWPVQVQCVKSPVELNTSDDESYSVKVVDADTLEINELNAHCLKAFSGSGLLVLNAPADLTGWNARAQVRTKVGGELLFAWHSDIGQAPDALITIDTVSNSFVLNMSAEQSAALTWKRGVYDMEAISPAGEVIAMTAISAVTVAVEVTV